MAEVYHIQGRWILRGGGETFNYVVSVTWVLKMARCPETGCLEVAHRAGGLR